MTALSFQSLASHWIHMPVNSLVCTWHPTLPSTYTPKMEPGHFSLNVNFPDHWLISGFSDPSRKQEAKWFSQCWTLIAWCWHWQWLNTLEKSFQWTRTVRNCWASSFQYSPHQDGDSTNWGSSEGTIDKLLPVPLRGGPYCTVSIL